MGLILGLIYLHQGDSQQSAHNLLGLFFILTMYQVRHPLPSSPAL